MIAHSKDDKVGFVGWTIYTMMALSMLTVVGTVAGSVYYMIHKMDPSNWVESLPLFLAVVMMVAPLIISLHRYGCW